MLGRKRAIITGSIIMVIGAAIQCASFSLPQLIVSRLITGFGNGKLGPLPPLLRCLPSMQLCMRADSIRHRNQYFNGADLAIRDLQAPQTRPDGHDRRIPHRLRRDAELLDRSRLFVPRALDDSLAIPNCVPDHPRPICGNRYPRAARVSSMAHPQGTREGSARGSFRALESSRRGPKSPQRLHGCQGCRP